MRQTIYILVFVLFPFGTSSAQNKDINQIGKLIFEATKDIDTIKLKTLIPTKEDFLGFIDESPINNIEKEKFLKDLNTYYPDFKNRMIRKLKAANSKGNNFAEIDWQKTIYLETQIEPNSTANPINTTDIAIKFSFLNTIYILRTKLIYYKTYFIADRIDFDTN